MKIKQINKEQVLEYLLSYKREVFVLDTTSMTGVNLCTKSINVIKKLLDTDDYVYFVLNGGDSNE